MTCLDDLFESVKACTFWSGPVPISNHLPRDVEPAELELVRLRAVVRAATKVSAALTELGFVAMGAQIGVGGKITPAELRKSFDAGGELHAALVALDPKVYDTYAAAQPEVT